jgi:hypothetical protein
LPAIVIDDNQLDRVARRAVRTISALSAPAPR